MQSRTTFFLTLAVLAFLAAMGGTAATEFGLQMTHDRMGLIVGAGSVALCSFFAFVASHSATR